MTNLCLFLMPFSGAVGALILLPYLFQALSFFFFLIKVSTSAVVFYAMPGAVDMCEVVPHQAASPREHRGGVAKFMDSGWVSDRDRCRAVQVHHVSNSRRHAQK